MHIMARYGEAIALLALSKIHLLWSYVICSDSLRACNELRKVKDRSPVTSCGRRHCLTFRLSVALNPVAPNRCGCPSWCVCNRIQ